MITRRVLPIETILQLDNNTTFYMTSHKIFHNKYSIYNFGKRSLHEKRVSESIMKYEGQSKNTKTFVVAMLLNVISLLNLVDIIKQ